jgi:hypothetical protein
MAGIDTMWLHKNIIQDAFITKDYDSTSVSYRLGVVAAKAYILGDRRDVVIDDVLPFPDSSNKPFFTQPSPSFK